MRARHIFGIWAWRWLIVGVLLFSSLVATPARAATDVAYVSATGHYFPETQHVVQFGFKDIWETRGGLKVFGLPLSGEVEEQLADGQVHTIQYFERSRFEYWPDQASGQRVLLSLLGRQFAPPALT